VAPTRVGAWELTRSLGCGQISHVWCARPVGSPADQADGYAVKLLSAPWDTDPRGLEMLCREARVGRKVSHAHLIPILAAGLSEPPYYVVMPRLEGQTLESVLVQSEGGQREGLVASHALWIARQIAEALAALYDSSWMHADVKPSNVFLSPTGHVTLIDLGFARRLDEMSNVASRPILGTLNYMAPEMLVSGLKADIRSDIYSLGVTLFRMLTGRLPFDVRDVAQLAEQHRQNVPGNLRVLAPLVPTRVARLVRQMLAKEPLRRPQTPRELIERLARLEIETFSDRAVA
jgi:serine/threonine-protein kinase